MKENREQRRKAQKQHRKPLNKNIKVISILLSFIVLLACFLSITGSAYSGSTDDTQITTLIPYEDITFSTQTSPDHPTYYKSYNFPNTIVYGGSQHNYIETPVNQNPQNGTIGKIPRSKIISTQNTLTNVPDTAINIDTRNIINGNSTLYGSLNGDIYKEITSIHGYIYNQKPYNSPYDLGDYNKGVYKIFAFFEDGDIQILIDNTDGNSVIATPYIWWANSSYTTIKQCVEHLKNNNIVSDIEYELLYSMFVASAIEWQNESGYYDYNQQLNFNQIVEESPSEKRAFATSTLTLNKLWFGNFYTDNGQYKYTINMNAKDFYIAYKNFNRDRMSISVNAPNFVTFRVLTVGAVIVTDIENLVDEDGNAWNVIKQKTINFTYEGTYNASEKNVPLIGDLRQNPDIMPYFNSNEQYLSVAFVKTTINIYFDFTSTAIEEQNNTTEIQLNYWYDTAPNSQQWWNAAVGDFFTQPIKPSNPHEIPNLIEWLANTTSDFMATDIIYELSIGEIVWFIIGLTFLFAVLKYFAGG